MKKRILTTLLLLAVAGAASAQPEATPAKERARGAAGVLLGEPPGATNPVQASAAERFAKARTWLYQLQKLDPAAVAKSDFDILVTDPSRDGDDANWWDEGTVRTLQRGGRLVIAYLSIGEAEDYRGYWRKEWKKKPPRWLGPENPDWKGNYKVRYWDPDWQQVLLGPGGPLERLLARGYDGVYLDIVDAWEHWSDAEELSAEEAQRRMVALVRRIATQARAKRPGFLVIPQNAPEVAARKDLLDTISGLALEDTFFMDDDRRRPKDTEHLLKLAAKVRAAGKPVLAVDYCRRRKLVDEFYRRAAAAGLVPYATVRALDRLTVDPGHAPPSRPDGG
ncbi:MAG: MJ1477/TM1410 family putative glycoside hydrolase [Planctomycetota bacterium]